MADFAIFLKMGPSRACSAARPAFPSVTYLVSNSRTVTSRQAMISNRSVAFDNVVFDNILFLWCTVFCTFVTSFDCTSGAAVLCDRILPASCSDAGKAAICKVVFERDEPNSTNQRRLPLIFCMLRNEKGFVLISQSAVNSSFYPVLFIPTQFYLNQLESKGIKHSSSLLYAMN